ncbi:MAG: GNAT family N-acetyltransferase [Chloroflexi bacterium]|nr:GNAT family N-acetyltransferase [Chloroflexota bacterium]
MSLIWGRATILDMPLLDITLAAADLPSQSAVIQAINAAYADYYIPLSLTDHAYQTIIERETVDLTRSVVAIFRGQVIGTCLLGVRDNRGWVGGVGVIPRYQGKGVARSMMKHLIESARQDGLTSLQLEVVEENNRARNLYESLGFDYTYRLHGLVASSNHLHLNGSGPTSCYEPDVASLIDEMQPLVRTHRPWQREESALRYVQQNAHGLALRHQEKDRLLSACVYQSDGYQVGFVDCVAANALSAVDLLASVVRQHPDARYSYLNVSDNDPFLPILQQVGFQPYIFQLEMLLNLNEDTP